jgi:hypothetical protein
MPQVNKIDSNITGLAYAEEAVLGYLPGENGNAGTPTWWRLEPNSYNDFGGEIKTVTPNPINPSRQRKKGVSVDVDAMGGFNSNLSFYNLLDLMQGVMYADLRKKGEYVITNVDTTDDSYDSASVAGLVAGHLVVGIGFTNSGNNGIKEVATVGSGTFTVTGNLVTEASPPARAAIHIVGFKSATGDVDVDASTGYPKLTSTSLDFTTLGLVAGQWIYVGGDSAGTSFTTAANNGYKRIRSISANEIVIDKSSTTMVTEANTTATVHIYFGDVLKNELSTDIVRRSYQLERTLGVPDTDNPTDIQTEVLKGAVPNEVTINIPQAELITVDMTFMAIDNEQRDATTGPKQSSVLNPFAGDIFNSTSDVSRIRMVILENDNENPTPLFAFLTEATFTINNNVSTDKAIGIFGGFDMTTGTLEIGGSVTAYFSDVDAVRAVRDNEDVSIDMILAKDNQGIVLDMPLVALGDGRLNVEQDSPITLPLSMDAATAVTIDENLDYTLMFTYFRYLPTVAM